MPLIDSIVQEQETFAEIRRELHQNPQTAYEEEFASSLVARKLEEWGIPYKRGIATTGIMATIEGQDTSSGKSIALRADMDALNITEKTGLAHSSQTPGKMHACGHDGHTATLLCAAKHLSTTRHFNGKVHLIFQPAEEGGRGANRMLEEGIFDEFPCDFVFGLHNWPMLPVGQIATRVGPLLASVDEFEFKITAAGGHAAMPQFTNDPLMIATQLSNALQTIVSRNVDPIETAVVSICNFNVGTGAFNIIADTATLNGTVRTFSQEIRQLIRERIHTIATHICAAFDAEVEISYVEKVDPTVNTADGVEMAVHAATAVVGAPNVSTDFPPTMGGEDFGAFLLERPGAFLIVGQGVEDPDSPHNQILHSPYYDFNDEILPIGSSLFVQLVEQYMPA